MADNLSVRSPGSGGAAVTGAPAKGQKGDAAAEELARLKQLAKTRSGKNVSDSQLRNIIKRRSARKAHKARVENTKAEFETEQASEKRGDAAQMHQARTAKTTGKKDIRSAKDGLTPEDRKSISSDPDAGPKLPPALAKPATPEQAKKLLTTLLDNVEIGGEPLDLEAYAKTLEKTPPTRPRQAPRQQETTARRRGTPTPGRAAPPAQAHPPGQKAGAGQRPGPPAQQRTPGQSRGPGARQSPGEKSASAALSRGSSAMTAARGGAKTPDRGASSPRTTPGGPGPGLKPGAPGAGSLAAGARLAKSVAAMGQAASQTGAHEPAGMTSASSRSAAANTGTSGDSWNAGGGLLSDSGSWDGMNFNWDGFFSLFLIRNQKDLGEWKRAMRDLRQASFKAELASHDLAIQMQKMRDAFKRIKGQLDFAQSISTAVEKFSNEHDKAKANAAAGEDPAKVAKTDGELRRLFEHDPRLTQYRDRRYLSPAEREALPKDLRTKIDDLYHQREAEGGPVATIGFIQAEQTRLRRRARELPDTEGAEATRLNGLADGLQGELDAARTRFEGAMELLGGDEDAMEILIHRRAAHSQIARGGNVTDAELQARYDAAMERKNNTPAPGPDATDAERTAYDRVQNEFDQACAAIAHRETEMASLYSLRAIDERMRDLRPQSTDGDQHMLDQLTSIDQEIGNAFEQGDRGSARTLFRRRNEIAGLMPIRLLQQYVADLHTNRDAATDPVAQRRLDRRIDNGNEMVKRANRGPAIDVETYAQIRSEFQSRSEGIPQAEEIARLDGEVASAQRDLDEYRARLPHPPDFATGLTTRRDALRNAQARAQVGANERALIEANDARQEAQVALRNYHGPGGESDSEFKGLNRRLQRTGFRVQQLSARAPPPALIPHSAADIQDAYDARMVAAELASVQLARFDQETAANPPVGDLAIAERNAARARILAPLRQADAKYASYSLAGAPEGAVADAEAALEAHGTEPHIPEGTSDAERQRLIEVHATVRKRLQENVAALRGAHQGVISADLAVQNYVSEHPGATAENDPQLSHSIDERDSRRAAVGQLENPRLARLRASAEAGDKLFNYSADLQPGKLESWIKSGAVGLYRGAEIMESFINEGPWVQAVDKSIGLALGLARKQRKATQGQMQQVVSQSQGMINQLIQVMGMSRSR